MDEFILLRSTEKDGMITDEYSLDGETVTHTAEYPVPAPIDETTLEDKINYLYYKGMGVI